MDIKQLFAEFPKEDIHWRSERPVQQVRECEFGALPLMDSPERRTKRVRLDVE